MNKEIQETIRRTSSAKGDGTRYGHQLGRCCDFHHEAEDLYVDKNKTRNHPWLCTRRSHLISIADLKKKRNGNIIYMCGITRLILLWNIRLHPMYCKCVPYRKIFPVSKGSGTVISTAFRSLAASYRPDDPQK